MKTKRKPRKYAIPDTTVWGVLLRQPDGEPPKLIICHPDRAGARAEARLYHPRGRARVVRGIWCPTQR